MSLRALSFEQMFSMRNHDYNQTARNTYVQIFHSTFSGMDQTATITCVPEAESTGGLFPDEVGEAEPVDVIANIEQQVIDALQTNDQLIEKIESSEGAAWGSVKAFFMEHLPKHLDNRSQLAYQLVKKAMDRIYGVQDQYWETYRNPDRNHTTYVRKKG